MSDTLITGHYRKYVDVRSWHSFVSGLLNVPNTDQMIQKWKG